MIDGLKGSHAVNTLCHAFGVHRSSFRYWLAHSRHEFPLSPAMVSAAGIPLTRYRAAKVMSKLNLKSCQPPRAINKNRVNQCEKLLIKTPKPMVKIPVMKKCCAVSQGEHKQMKNSYCVRE